LTIGGRIAELRKGKGLTQTKLAQLTGINASTLAAYERNRRTPKNDAIASIANVLGVSVEALEAQTETLATVTTSPREEILAQAADASNKASAAHPASEETNLTTLTLTREEARLILFTRMNPECMNFLQKYITSEQRERDQVEKAWKLIHEFQA
jgi:transcriptional regulator with XRE-family HTH domain